MTSILASGSMESWGALSMTITGDADWDTTLFSKLKANTLTENQASALWKYTDGYKVQITGSTLANFNPTKQAKTTGATLLEADYQASCTGLAQTTGNGDPTAIASFVTWPQLGCPVQTAPSRTQEDVDKNGGFPSPCQFCRQTFCVTKSAAANSAVNNDDIKANAGRVADGYYCFEMDRARMDFMQYWKSDDFATTGMAAGATAKWGVVYDAGRAINRVSEASESAEMRDPSNPVNNQAAIFPSAGTTNSIVAGDLTAVPWVFDTTAGPPSLAAGVGKIDVSWYQPKWQKNDYYQYNFRINYTDSVTVKYCTVALETVIVRQTNMALRLESFNATERGPISTGMLPVVLPQGVRAGATNIDTLNLNALYLNTCVWATGTATASAGPKNGAAQMLATMTTVALGAAALAF